MPWTFSSTLLRLCLAIIIVILHPSSTRSSLSPDAPDTTRIYAIRVKVSSYRRFLSSITDVHSPSANDIDTIDTDPADFFLALYNRFCENYVGSTAITGASLSSSSSPIHYRFLSMGFRRKGYVLVSLSPSTVPLFENLYSTYIESIYPIDDDNDKGEIDTEPSYGILTMNDSPSSSSYSATVQPSSESFYNWGLDRIDQRNGNLDQRPFTVHPSMNGEGIDIYLLDTGIQPYHQEFRTNSIEHNYTKILYHLGQNFLPDQNASNVIDTCHGHGTMVASQISGNNVGVAPKVSIIPIRVIGCDGRFLISNVLKGIDYAVHTATDLRNNPNRSVINLSGRAFAISPPLDDAATIVSEAFLSFVVASGNEGKNACLFSPNTKTQLPQHYPVVVGGTLQPQLNLSTIDASVPVSTPSEFLAEYSNYGTCVDINGPSENIYGANYLCSNCYRLWSGTSFSTPLVTGIVAGIRQNFPTWSPACVRKALLRMGTPDIVNERIDHNTTRTMAYYSTIGGGYEIPLVC